MVSLTAAPTVRQLSCHAAVSSPQSTKRTHGQERPRTAAPGQRRPVVSRSRWCRRSTTESDLELHRTQEARSAPAPVVASESAAVTARHRGGERFTRRREDADEDTFVPVAPPDRAISLPDWEPDAVSVAARRPRLRSVGRWPASSVALIAAIGFADLLPPSRRSGRCGRSRGNLPRLAHHAAQRTPNHAGRAPDPHRPGELTPDEVSSTVPAIGDLNTDATIVIRQATAPAAFNTAPRATHPARGARTHSRAPC